MSQVLRSLGPMRSPIVVCALLALSVAAFGGSKKGSAQSSKGSGSSAPPQGDASASNPEGFAIESEMLTYTAMDSEATALSCGIGKNVGAADSGCNAQAISGPPVGVVVVAGDSSALSEFQLWRTDISTMDMLTLRANHYCAPSASTRAATTLAGTIMGMFPESQAAEFAASLLSATAETKPLEGNILDRTLVDDVAGHLRSLGIDVVIPDDYMPYSLAAIDANHSPFLTKYVALIKARDCVAPKGNADASPAAEPAAAGTGAADTHDEADKHAISDAIDSFSKSLHHVLRQLLGRVEASMIDVRSRRNELVEQLAVAMLLARLGVLLSHRQRLAERSSPLRRDHKHRCARRTLLDELPLVRFESCLGGHRNLLPTRDREQAESIRLPR